MTIILVCNRGASVRPAREADASSPRVAQPAGAREEANRTRNSGAVIIMYFLIRSTSRAVALAVLWNTAVSYTKKKRRGENK